MAEGVPGRRLVWVGVGGAARLARHATKVEVDILAEWLVVCGSMERCHFDGGQRLFVALGLLYGLWLCDPQGASNASIDYITSESDLAFMEEELRRL